MFCPICGAKVNEGVKFCFKCGTQMVVEEQVISTMFQGEDCIPEDIESKDSSNEITVEYLMAEIRNGDYEIESFIAELSDELMMRYLEGEDILYDDIVTILEDEVYKRKIQDFFDGRE